ncbi:MAG: hypothetical protein ED555_11050 [Allomuricauda sp.]|nr:MAG: hypothetical protein ED555_11050 [Allomuricauda sp.]
MKRILKIFGVLVLLLIVGGFIYAWAKHEPLPDGTKGNEADLLGQQMLTALNNNAYQNTRYFEWSFSNGATHYVWDKELGTCLVQRKDVEVNLNLNRPLKSSVVKNGTYLRGVEKEKAIESALDSFNNDSFWLVAPYKIFDQGTERRLVNLDKGEKGLLVTYTQGGSTPGDSYLWLLNDNGFPYAFKMWVSILPVGGIEASWDNWLITESGTYLPKSHKMGPFDFSMGLVKAYHE